MCAKESEKEGYLKRLSIMCKHSVHLHVTFVLSHAIASITVAPTRPFPYDNRSKHHQRKQRQRAANRTRNDCPFDFAATTCAWCRRREACVSVLDHNGTDGWRAAASHVRAVVIISVAYVHIL